VDRTIETHPSLEHRTGLDVPDAGTPTINEAGTVDVGVLFIRWGAERGHQVAAAVAHGPAVLVAVAYVLLLPRHPSAERILRYPYDSRCRVGLHRKKAVWRDRGRENSVFYTRNNIKREKKNQINKSKSSFAGNGGLLRKAMTDDGKGINRDLPNG
jgi:hypothetical protein